MSKWTIILGVSLVALLEGSAEKLNAAPPVIVSISLQDCLRIAHDRQPRLRGLQASLEKVKVQADALQRASLISQVARPDLPLRAKQAQVAIQIAEARLEFARNLNTYAVTRLYYSVVLANAQLELIEENLGRLVRFRKTVESNLPKGAFLGVIEFAMSLVDAAIHRLRLREVKGREARYRALGALKEAMGLEQTVPLHIAESTFPLTSIHIDRRKIFALAEAYHPAIRLTQNLIPVFELEIQAQHKRKFVRQLSTFAIGTDLHSEPLRTGESRESYSPAGMGVDMPTVLVGARSSRVKEAQLLTARAIEVARKSRNLVLLDAEDAYRKWESASQRLALEDKRVKQIKEAFQKTEERFEKRLPGLTVEMVLTENVFVDRAQANFNAVAYELMLAFTELQLATGGGFSLPCR